MEIIDLDHIMVNISNFASAEERFGKMGFALRGRRQVDVMGGGGAGGDAGSNAIIFPGKNPDAANYLELSYWDRVYTTKMMKEIMREPEGGVLLVHSTDDAQSLHDKWTESGLHLNPLFDIEFPAGDRAAAQAMRVIIPQGGKDLVQINACQYTDLSDYKDKEKMGHENTAVCWDIARVFCADDKLDETLNFFESVYGRPPDKRHPASARYDIARVSVEVICETEARAQFGGVSLSDDNPLPYIGGIRVRVRDKDAALRCLTANGVSFQETERGSICTYPKDGCGLIVEFTEDEK